MQKKQKHIPLDHLIVTDKDTLLITSFSTKIADLHAPKKRFFLPVLFEQFIFLLTPVKKGLSANEKPLFLRGSAKKKELLKRTAFSGHVNRVKVYMESGSSSIVFTWPNHLS